MQTCIMSPAWERGQNLPLLSIKQLMNAAFFGPYASASTVWCWFLWRLLQNICTKYKIKEEKENNENIFVY